MGLIPRGCGRSAGQDEAGQRLEIGVHRIDLAFQPLDLAGRDAECAFHVARSRNVGAEVEHLVLDHAQAPSVIAFDERGSDADGAVRFVNLADRVHAWR